MSIKLSTSEITSAAKECAKKSFAYTDEMKDYNEDIFTGFMEAVRWLQSKISTQPLPAPTAAVLSAEEWFNEEFKANGMFTPTGEKRLNLQSFLKYASQLQSVPLVSAEEVLKRLYLKQDSPDIFTWEQYQQSWDFEMVIAAMHEFRNQQPASGREGVGRWIICGDRMPEKEGVYFMRKGEMKTTGHALRRKNGMVFCAVGSNNFIFTGYKTWEWLDESQPTPSTSTSTPLKEDEGIGWLDILLAGFTAEIMQSQSAHQREEIIIRYKDKLKVHFADPQYHTQSSPSSPKQ